MVAVWICLAFPAEFSIPVFLTICLAINYWKAKNEN